MTTGGFIGIDVSGIAELQAKLGKLPREAQDTITDDISKYMLDVLRAYPPKMSGPTRESVYGTPFKTDKQRRWFFAALRRGEIQVPYHRNQNFADNWKQVGTGKTSIIANETPYGGYLMDDNSQSLYMAAKGWQKLGTVVKNHMVKMVKIADGGVKKAIHKLGLG